MLVEARGYRLVVDQEDGASCGVGRPGTSHQGRESEPGDLPRCMVLGLIREGVRRCVGGKSAEGVCCRQRMTSEALPSTKPLYFQVSERAEAELFGGGSHRTFMDYIDVPVHEGKLS